MVEEKPLFIKILKIMEIVHSLIISKKNLKKMKKIVKNKIAIAVKITIKIKKMIE